MLHELALFAGYGGFPIGLKLAVGPDNHRTVAYVERDSHAAATLVARMGEASLDRAPIYDDVTTFDGKPWRGRVDIITGGFPCQPFSAAGQRRGVDDERWLWGDIARIVADVGPRFVFLENVPQLVGRGLPHVLADLTQLGFDAEWGLLSAADVGATHRRVRLWILGHARGSGRPEVAGSAYGDEGAHGAQHGHLAHGPSQDVADANSERPRRQRDALGRSIDGTQTGGSGETLADANEPGHQRRGPAEPTGRALTRQCGMWPPVPDDDDGWSEWIAAGGPEPSLRRSPDGTTGELVRPNGLSERLHLLGNGLVPLACGAAFLQLCERLGVEP